MTRTRVPYRMVGGSAHTEPLPRLLIELVEDHPADCRCSPGGSGRGYPHHLIPAARPWRPRARLASAGAS